MTTTGQDPLLSTAGVQRANGGGSAVYVALVCLVASLAGLLFGFDTAVISGTVTPVAKQFALSDMWQGWFVSSALLGCIIGAAVSGMLGDRFGRKPILFIAAICFFICGFFAMILRTFTVLIVARVIGGSGVGMASVLAPMYISEFAPPRWRGRLVTFYQLSIVIGVLAAYLSNFLLAKIAISYAGTAGSGWFYWIVVDQTWRSMLGAEIIPAILFFLLLFFVPESPRWLIENGRERRGYAVLEKVGGAKTAERELREIKIAAHDEPGSLVQLLRPGLRRALLVGVLLSVFGQLTGVNIVVYYGPLILKAAGFHQLGGTLLGQVGLGVINLVFTILAMFFVDRLGRRPLLLSGMTVVTVMLALIGVLFLFADVHHTGAGGVAHVGHVSKTLAILIGLSVGIYMAALAFSICAVIWVLTPEIFPNRVRGRAASIATFANWGTNAVSAQVFPIYVAAFGMYAGFFSAAAVCLVATVFFFKFVPETKGRTLEQIERFWTAPVASPSPLLASEQN